MHRSPDGRHIHLGGAVNPRRVGAQHRHDTVTMLPGHPQQILTEHELPAHGRVACHVGPPMTQLQRPQALAPPNGGAQQIANGLTGILEEDVVVDLAGRLQARAQLKLPYQNGQRPRAEFDAAIFAGLCLAPIDAMDARLVDADNAVDEVDIGEHEGNFLRRPQAREKAKLIVIALRLAPIAVNGAINASASCMENGSMLGRSDFRRRMQRSCRAGFSRSGRSR